MIPAIERPNLSLKVQLVIVVGLSLLILGLLPSFFFMSSLREQLKTEVISDICKELKLAHKIIHSPDRRNGLQKEVLYIKQLTGDRITCIADDGTVLADSDVPEGQIKDMDNHSSRPEVKMARARGLGYSIRYSGTLEKKMIYAAQKSDGSRPAFLRIARPYSLLDQGLKNTQNKTFRATLFTLLCTSCLICLFFAVFNKRIKQMALVAQAIGQGNFGQRITKVPSREFLPLGKAINDMAREISSKIALISKQRRELETIFSAIDTGIVVLNQEGRILMVNRSFLKIYPEAHNFINHYLIELTLDQKLQEKSHALLQTVQTRTEDKIPSEEKNRQPTLLNMEKDGHYYQVRFIPARGQKDWALLILFHEISELKKAENMRRDFIANISHELRTPLTAIKGYAETLLDNPCLSASQHREFLNIILRNSDQMSTLLKDILLLSRIEAGKMQLNRQDIDLREIIHRAWNNLQHCILDKNIKFIINIQEQSSMACTDPVALLTVLQNILDNSIKFVPEQNGRITIMTQYKQNKLIVGIEDNGPGIPPDRQERIFERFYQVDKPGEKQDASLYPGFKKGTGLGLSICKNILQRLDERIWVQSPIKNGRGTIFWFTLTPSKKT